MLTESQKSFFHQNGYLVVDNVVGEALLARLKAEFERWVAQSREHAGAFGETMDGRARFSVEPGHSAARPALRRVNSPVEISPAYMEAMRDSAMVDAIADLIGPNVKYHHSKVNSKMPGAATKVNWHQDFPFTPHTNDDLVTALLMVDEVTAENGPLTVVPGSHIGPIHDLWRDGKFTGAVAEETARTFAAQGVQCTGKAGAVCLMHTRLLHSSEANLSTAPRTLFISVYSAEDAVPICANPIPSRFEGMVVRGTATGRVRSVPFQLSLPEHPKGASFFEQQAAATMS
ncbi:phytanoyl-CoA dioxygenase family protein [Robbsia sp. KACC 23696]|uniref:phytanoyl-CoA dioxygenase family protein n=1 Tax=Robbsia sp. KACC 23696 TaxID=3149231 RepID=UPI00325A4B82